MLKMNTKRWISIVTHAVVVMILLAIVAVSSFAWVATNRKSNANGIPMEIQAPDSVTIEPTLIAVRTCLTGEIVTDTCNVDNEGHIYLLERQRVNERAVDDEGQVYTETSTETHTLDEKVPFVINEILPGEHIDITFGFSLSDAYDGMTYKVALGDITGDQFQIDHHTHNASGAFLYQPISLKNEADESVDDFSTAELEWFVTYNYETDDEAVESVLMVEKDWNKDDRKLYFTFRVQESFSQYYELVGKAQEAFGNLLSQKSMNIGSIILGVDSDE